MSAAPRRERVRAFWCRIPSRANFGDALTPWLIRRLTGLSPRFTRPDEPVHKYLVAGSVVAYAGAQSTVWGAGILARDDEPSPEAEFRCVRGPLTRDRVLRCGGTCPETYGDPALLLPHLYTPSPRERSGIGLLPHFSDLPRVAASLPQSDDVRLIDVKSGVERVVDAVTSCELVASSSLHGLIASHAYGVPAVWIKFRDLPSGDDSKFRDYLLSAGLSPSGPVWVEAGRLDHAKLRDLAVPAPNVDAAPLLASCPFADAA